MNLLEIMCIDCPQCNLIHIMILILFPFQWAHFPNIHFGLGPHESINSKLDESLGAPGHPQKVQGLY